MTQPRVLLYDIETSPIEALVWRTYQTDVVRILEDWQILCFAWKWWGETTVKVAAQCDYEDYRPGTLNDLSVVATLRELFDLADVIVAHNGVQFDQKKARARMMANGLQPPSPAVELDTLREMKKVAAHTSNRLDSLNQTLDLERKIETGGIETWIGCKQGDPQAWARMKRYNRQDVRALSDLYEFMRPWMKQHPSLNVISDRPETCPRCLSPELVSRGFRVTKSRKYRRFVCTSCGGYSSSPRSERIPAPAFVA